MHWTKEKPKDLTKNTFWYWYKEDENSKPEILGVFENCATLKYSEGFWWPEPINKPDIDYKWTKQKPKPTENKSLWFWFQSFSKKEIWVTEIYQGCSKLYHYDGLWGLNPIQQPKEESEIRHEMEQALKDLFLLKGDQHGNENI